MKHHRLVRRRPSSGSAAPLLLPACGRRSSPASVCSPALGAPPRRHGSNAPGPLHSSRTTSNRRMTGAASVYHRPGSLGAIDFWSWIRYCKTNFVPAWRYEPPSQSLSKDVLYDRDSPASAAQESPVDDYPFTGVTLFSNAAEAVAIEQEHVRSEAPVEAEASHVFAPQGALAAFRALVAVHMPVAEAQVQFQQCCPSNNSEFDLLAVQHLLDLEWSASSILECISIASYRRSPQIAVPILELLRPALSDCPPEERERLMTHYKSFLRSISPGQTTYDAPEVVRLISGLAGAHRQKWRPISQETAVYRRLWQSALSPSSTPELSPDDMKIFTAIMSVLAVNPHVSQGLLFNPSGQAAPPKEAVEAIMRSVLETSEGQHSDPIRKRALSMLFNSVPALFLQEWATSVTLSLDHRQQLGGPAESSKERSLFCCWMSLLHSLDSMRTHPSSSDTFSATASSALASVGRSAIDIGSYLATCSMRSKVNILLQGSVPKWLESSPQRLDAAQMSSFVKQFRGFLTYARKPLALDEVLAELLVRLGRAGVSIPGVAKMLLQYLYRFEDAWPVFCFLRRLHERNVFEPLVLGQLFFRLIDKGDEAINALLCHKIIKDPAFPASSKTLAHFGLIVLQARANHLLPPSLAYASIHTMYESRDTLVHRLARSYSTDGTLSTCQAARACHHLYSFLQSNGMKIQTSMVQALLLTWFFRPLAERRQIRDSTIEMLRQVICLAQGEKIALASVEVLIERRSALLRDQAKRALPLTENLPARQVNARRLCKIDRGVWVHGRRRG